MGVVYTCVKRKLENERNGADEQHVCQVVSDENQTHSLPNRYEHWYPKCGNSLEFAIQLYLEGGRRMSQG